MSTTLERVGGDRSEPHTQNVTLPSTQKFDRKKEKKRTEMGQQIVSIGRVLARVIDSRESARAVSVNRYVVTRQRHLRSDHRNKSKNALWV